MSHAPLALFVFRRPGHAARTIAALKLCEGFAETPVHVFADAAKKPEHAAAVAETRALVRRELPDATLHCAEENRGLAQAIKAGVQMLVEQYGRVIVVEDDLLVSSDFLTWMNTALDKYNNVEKVVQISGHSFTELSDSKSYFLPFVTTWGWATWARSWNNYEQDISDAVSYLKLRKNRYNFDIRGAYPYTRMLFHNISGRINSWGIMWYWSTYKRGGLTLYPARSLVNNIGFDSSATHTIAKIHTNTYEIPESSQLYEFPDCIAIDEIKLNIIRNHLKYNRGYIKYIAERLTSMIGKF